MLIHCKKETIVDFKFNSVCDWFKGSCSSCSEEKSPMVPNPDPKQFWNKQKNNMSLFYYDNLVVTPNP